MWKHKCKSENSTVHWIIGSVPGSGPDQDNIVADQRISLGPLHLLRSRIYRSGSKECDGSSSLRGPEAAMIRGLGRCCRWCFVVGGALLSVVLVSSCQIQENKENSLAHRSAEPRLLITLCEITQTVKSWGQSV
jgi:hypothetical protein